MSRKGSEAILKYRYTLLYLISILVVNAGFVWNPLLINLGGGVNIPAWSFAVGLWFVLRDFSQRELGHLVLLPMGLGILMTAAMSKALAAASFLAAATAEILDWILYSVLKQPFHRRVLVSSLVSCPVDSMVFLAAVDYLQLIPGVAIFNWASVVAMSASKLVAALVIYSTYRAERPDAQR